MKVLSLFSRTLRTPDVIPNYPFAPSNRENNIAWDPNILEITSSKQNKTKLSEGESSSIFLPSHARPFEFEFVC